MMLRAWNWKAALLSACARAPLFFLTNLPAGVDAALAAGTTEFAYRAVAAGFYGALTEQFSRLRATRTTTLATVIVVPGVAHLIEYAVHTSAGTARAGTAVLVSIGLSVITTRINLFAM